MQEHSRPYDILKRSLDVVGALFLLVMLSPILLGIALVVAFDLGTPVIFRQVRAGRLGRPFRLLKFRTMRLIANGEGALEAVSSDEQRLTPIGRFLRSTSLDELPQLINVVTGAMSFVGPRPLLMEYLPLYAPEQARRHEVRPGITGLAQVSGRNAISWDERFALDIDYVDRRSLALDARIVIITIGATLRREGVAGRDAVTMKPFAGPKSHESSEEQL